MPHPDHLKQILTVKQMKGWIDYAGREPWGFHVDDARMSLVATVMSRLAGSSDIDPEIFKIATMLRFAENEAKAGAPSSAEPARSFDGLEAFFPNRVMVPIPAQPGLEPKSTGDATPPATSTT